LAALPKSAVSDIVERLRTVAHDRNSASEEGDTTSKEVTKGEEYVMKILNTGGSGSSLSDLTVFISGMVVLVVCGIGCAVLFYLVMVSETDTFRSQLPHLTTIFTSYAHDLAALYGLHKLGLNRSKSTANGTSFRIYLSNEEEVTKGIHQYLSSGRDAYYLASYGGDQLWQHPFIGWQEGVTQARNAMSCSTTYSETRKFSDAYNCFPPDLAYVSIEPFVISQISETDPPTLTGLWRLMITPLFDLFVLPMYQSILPTLVGDLWSQQTEAVTIVVVLLVAMVLVALVIWLEIGRISSHIRSVLRLLLHCPSMVMVQNSAIVSVLSGDFSGGRDADRDSRRNADFFESVFLRLPDAILYADSQMIVKRGNISAGRLFERDLTGEDLRCFFHSDKFAGNADAIFEMQGESAREPLVFHKNDGQETRISVSISDTGTEFVASCRDVTQSFRCNALIAEERKRSDDLLKTILPASLVPRVQAGEQNICFSVDMATILFLDIVSFTPWCGKLPAQTVMATLNDMFKRLDERLACKPTMTKIKCIGDCYMAAGGIFMEDIPQRTARDRPREHATEVVTFGLEAIQAMRELNADRNENLEIRVGVNTGGPIVAGVLGIGKPTFEILGPAINMAQQMEHNGVRMLVHITHDTYAQITPGPFTITDHGTTVKGQQIMTHLVSARSN
jgi:class 3 adenylate cyclase/PAS domain-containing protein